MPPALIDTSAGSADPPSAPTPLDGRLSARFAQALPNLAVAWKPKPSPAPQWLFLNRPLASELGLDAEALDTPAGLAVFAGNAVPAGATSVAQAYAGHQFGGLSPQLGDGRALLLGEVQDTRGQWRDIAFKGSGRTPFSRGGDGKAAVGPMLRELLISEAMHHLGIPTTRALAIVATGERVARDEALAGAVLTRVAASHLRVGSFQFLALRGDTQGLQRLLDHAIERHDPRLNDADLALAPVERVLAFVQGVANRQAALIAQWMHVGFVHGVMNTDNMTISGETIDYGPCAFMDAHDPGTVFSSIDHHGRYAYGNQPAIAQWNLARLAEAVLPLIAEALGEDEAVRRATQVVQDFQPRYQAAWLALARRKLGLGVQAHTDDAHTEADHRLAEQWLQLLHAQQVDHTLAWRRLADAAAGNEAPLRQLFATATAPDEWLASWRERLAVNKAEPSSRAAEMCRINPAVVPRNHRIEAALQAASRQGELAPVQQLLAMLARPFDADAEAEAFLAPLTPEDSRSYLTYCGT
jgi:serine/tyrosine/threonine adenylyltransferase